MAFWTSFFNKYTAAFNPAARVLFILFALTAATQPAHAQLQELVVTPISVDEGIPLFLNHPGMAVIIIRSSLTTLTFDSNYQIVEQQNDPAAGEYILIFEPVPQTIRVNAPGFMAQGIPLRGLSPRQVLYYSVEPAPDPESGRISVLFSVQPEQARLYVNGELSAANQTLQIEPGPAQVRIELDGYRLIEDQIDVSMDNIFFPIPLSRSTSCRFGFRPACRERLLPLTEPCGERRTTAGFWDCFYIPDNTRSTYSEADTLP